MIRIAQLCIDGREAIRDYDNPTPWFGQAPQALLQGFSRLPDVEVHVVSCIQQPMAAPDKLAPNIHYHALLVPKIGWLRTGYQGCVRAMRRKLVELQPDVVHGQGTERDSALGAAFSGFPNVLTIHGNMRIIARLNRARPFSYLWLAARLEQFALPRVGGVICITRHTQEAVAGLARRTWLVPNAVDQAFFDIQPDCPPGPPRILCVGTVCPLKNQITLLRALDPLARKHEFKVIFLGDAPTTDPYGREFHQLLAGRPWAEYGGFVNRPALRDQLSHASALVLPTREDNCPMVVLEAMAARVPVLASRVGGVPDLIEADRTGLFCRPEDPGSMEEGVRRLIEDPGLADRLAEAARAAALDRFHPEVVARRHLEVYAELLEGPGPKKV